MARLPSSEDIDIRPAGTIDTHIMHLEAHLLVFA